MPYKDPNDPRIKEVRQRHYEKNKAAIVKKVGARKKTNRAWFNAFKCTLKCTNCSENHPATLDFHHVVYSKTNKKVNELVSDGHAKNRIMQEIEKCVVLCSNCHRKHHHEERVTKRKLAKKKKSGNIHTLFTKKRGKKHGD